MPMTEQERNALVDRYLPLVDITIARALAIGLRSEIEADDVRQDMRLAVVQSVDRFRLGEVNDLDAYLHTRLWGQFVDSIDVEQKHWLNRHATSKRI